MQEFVERGDRFQFAAGVDHELTEPGLVQPQVEQGVVEFARQGEGPEAGVLGECRGAGRGRRFGRPEDGQVGHAEGAVELDPQRRVGDGVVGKVRFDRGPGRPAGLCGAVALCG